MEKFEYRIIEKLGTLSEGSKGWHKEMNLISWDGREPKYDIRDWPSDHQKPGKGITLSKDELKQLFELSEWLDL